MEKCTPTRIVHWLESVRNRATTRRNARCPIAKLALQRPWVLLWVCHRSRATIDQTWENTTCKTDIFVPLVVPGLSVNSGSNSSSTTLPQESLDLMHPSLWKQGCIKIIFRFSIRVKWRTNYQETGAIIPEGWQERCGRSVGRSSILVRGFHR